MVISGLCEGKKILKGCEFSKRTAMNARCVESQNIFLYSGSNYIRRVDERKMKEITVSLHIVSCPSVELWAIALERKADP